MRGAREEEWACHTFECLVDVTAEVIDPCSVIEACFSPLGHSVLCDIDRRVVVLLL